MSQVLTHSLSPFVLEFEVKGLPKMANQLLRGHWRPKYEHAKRWKNWVKAIAVQYRPEVPLKTAKLTLTRHSSNEPDFDSLCSGFKPVIDALVEVGILEDDKQINIKRPEYLWKHAKKKQGLITVRVEEA